jgi:hypothetical protein
MASTAFDSDGVRPADGVSKGFDIEKSINPKSHAVEANSDGGYRTDDSEKFQAGVQRVRAITEIWSKKTLIYMFILYVNKADSHIQGCS